MYQNPTYKPTPYFRKKIGLLYEEKNSKRNLAYSRGFTVDQTWMKSWEGWNFGAFNFIFQPPDELPWQLVQTWTGLLGNIYHLYNITLTLNVPGSNTKDCLREMKENHLQCCSGLFHVDKLPHGEEFSIENSEIRADFTGGTAMLSVSRTEYFENSLTIKSNFLYSNREYDAPISKSVFLSRLMG